MKLEKNKVFINDALSTKCKDMYCWTGKKYTPIQEQQIKIAQDKRSHLVQQIMQDERTDTEIYLYQSKWQQHEIKIYDKQRY